MKKIKILAIICALAMTTNVHAALQSRPGVDAKTNTRIFPHFKLIREMEMEGGPLCLSAKFAYDSSMSYNETTEANNIDSHLCKNTEWGATAILAISDFGSGNGNVKDAYNTTTKMYDVTASTTGNMTGVFGMTSGAAGVEYVAGGIIEKFDRTWVEYLGSQSKKYLDSYVDSSTVGDFSRYIPGDATYEVMSFMSWRYDFVHSSEPVFVRGGGNILGSGDSNGGLGGYGSLGSRAVIWVGDGI